MSTRQLFRNYKLELVKSVLSASAVLFTGCMFGASSASSNERLEKSLEKYNVIWETPSKGSQDSMPLSGGILGLNVWVENGDVCFLMGSPNCLNEQGMQVKLGLVKLHLPNNVFAKEFKQELRLQQSEVLVTGKTAAGRAVSIKLWCGVNDPVIHVETTSEEAIELSASYETWSGYTAKFVKNSVQWSRRLAEVNARRARDIKKQGMQKFASSVPDPLSKLTCGGMMSAAGMKPAGTATGKFNGMATRIIKLKTVKPVKTLDLCIAIRMEQDKSLGEWQEKLATFSTKSIQNASQDRQQALNWWKKFWNRSHIVVKPDAPATDKAWQGGRNYQLARYQLASNRHGRMMTLFNGGNFSCTGNPDKRFWDGCQFMGQNQMLVYWPMMRSGDFDMLKIGCDFYKSITAMRRMHAKKFWGIDGATYPEPLSIFGLDAIGTNAEGRCNMKHLHYHYTSSMVFALMMLGHDAYTETTTPGYTDTALGIIRYYDNFYQKKLKKETGKPLDANGKLTIYPSDALEHAHGCTNNIDVLAGLKALSRDLLASPANVLNAKKRAYIKGFTTRIADFKTEVKEGRKLYSAYDKKPDWIFHHTIMEFPQMYICFPFNAVSLGRSDMELVKNTWELGPVNPAIQHLNFCWHQNAINLARMGDVERASSFTLEKLLHPGFRFPTFYHTKFQGRSFDHPPDTDHAGCSMIALQEMMMQTDGKRILLLPGWPKNWNADFKLHAPLNTTVEGRVVNGKILDLKVTPESRRKDIEIFNPPTLTRVEVKTATASSQYNDSYSAEKAVDGNHHTRWSMTAKSSTGWLEVDLGKPIEISRIIIEEESYPQTSKFSIEAQNADGTWKTLIEGSTIGAHKEVKFTPYTAQKFRLVIKGAKLTNANSAVTIDEIKIYTK